MISFVREASSKSTRLVAMREDHPTLIVSEELKQRQIHHHEKALVSHRIVQINPVRMDIPQCVAQNSRKIGIARVHIDHADLTFDAGDAHCVVTAIERISVAIALIRLVRDGGAGGLLDKCACVLLQTRAWRAQKVLFDDQVTLSHAQLKGARANGLRKG
jgi:hypothetical protein